MNDLLGAGLERLVPWMVQATLVSGGAWLVLWMLPSSSPHVRRAVASAALLAFLVPPLRLAPAAVTVPAPSGPDSGGWLVWTLAVHALGLVFVLAQATPELLRVLRGTNGRVVHDPHLRREYEAVGHALGLRRLPPLFLDEEGQGPCVSGILTPRVVIPLAHPARLSTPALRMVLAHELVHVRQGDLWWGWVRLLACSLWWFHPLAWAIAREHRDLAEMCCDATLRAELGSTPLELARGLEEAAALESTPSRGRLVPCFLGTGGASLPHRVRLLARSAPDAWSRRGRRLAVAVALAVLPLGLAWFAPATDPEPRDRVFFVHPHDHHHSH